MKHRKILEKNRMVLPETDMKWMDTANNKITKTKKIIIIWINPISRFSRTLWDYHKLSIAINAMLKMDKIDLVLIGR